MPLPTPRTWTDGEDPTNIPSADDLNLDWRDSFNFLIGYNRPIAFLQSTTSQALATNTIVTVNFQNELIKRGGMVHAVNGASVTVPYTGQYTGFMYGGFLTMSTLSTRLMLLLQINVTTGGSRVDGSPLILTDHQLQGSFTLNLQANDSVTMTQRTSAGTATTSNSALNYSKLAIWYVGDST